MCGGITCGGGSSFSSSSCGVSSCCGGSIGCGASSIARERIGLRQNLSSCGVVTHCGVGYVTPNYQKYSEVVKTNNPSKKSTPSHSSGFSLPKLAKASDVLRKNKPISTPNPAMVTISYEQKNFVCIGYNVDNDIVQLLDIDNGANISYYMDLKEVRKLQKSEKCNTYGIRVDSDLKVNIKVKESMRVMTRAGVGEVFDLSTVERNLRDAKDFLEEEEEYEY